MQNHPDKAKNKRPDRDFTRVPNVFFDIGLSAFDLSVLLQIYRFDHCFLSQKALGDKLQISKRTVARSIKSLLEKGMIEKLRRDGKSVYYRVTSSGWKLPNLPEIGD